jgi:hypothetical protein
MAREAFTNIRFSPDRLDLISSADKVVEEFRALGYKMTVRQVYYRLVKANIIKNNQKAYKQLASAINDARMCGLMDWDAIEDRTRNLKPVNAWESPGQIIEAVADQYKEDLWSGQNVRFEVWIEKDALTGVVEPTCTRLRVPFFACRGYTSQSEQYAAGKRLGRYVDRGLRPIVLHLGDHDPSGLDMTRDNRDRLSIFAGVEVEVIRLALNREQIDELDLPPNPAKTTDSRAGDEDRAGTYIYEHGRGSWELDALDPPYIDALITAAVEAEIDTEAWEIALEEEEQSRRLMRATSENWEDVVEFLDGRRGDDE